VNSSSPDLEKQYGHFFTTKKQLKDIFGANYDVKFYFLLLFLRHLAKILYIRNNSLIKSKYSTKNHRHKTSLTIILIELNALLDALEQENNEKLSFFKIFGNVRFKTFFKGATTMLAQKVMKMFMSLV
jgi:hypothetical protein